MWRSKRKHITLEGLEERGHLLNGPATENIQPASETSGAERDERPVGANPAPTANLIGDAWLVSPDVSDLLDALAYAATVTEPSESGMIRAATKTRQHNAKTEYIRAIAYRLDDADDISFSKQLFHAIALVAPVAMGDSELDVTYDDVRKTLR